MFNKVQSQKTVLAEIIFRNVVFIRKNDSRGKPIELEKD